jgi:hypothetical protein
MAEVVVFHHALGLTNAVRRFAAGLRSAGHTVHTPDLYDGRTFDTIEDGMAHAEQLGGPPAIVDRARAEVASLPDGLVYAGLSLGVLPAQSLAQTRPGAQGAFLCYSALPLGEWGDNWPAEWPEGVPFSCTSSKATRTSRSRSGSRRPSRERSSSSIPGRSITSRSTTTRRPPS